MGKCRILFVWWNWFRELPGQLPEDWLLCVMSVSVTRCSFLSLCFLRSLFWISKNSQLHAHRLCVSKSQKTVFHGWRQWYADLWTQHRQADCSDALKFQLLPPCKLVSDQKPESKDLRASSQRGCFNVFALFYQNTHNASLLWSVPSLFRMLFFARRHITAACCVCFQAFFSCVGCFLLFQNIAAFWAFVVVMVGHFPTVLCNKDFGRNERVQEKYTGCHRKVARPCRSFFCGKSCEYHT